MPHTINMKPAAMAAIQMPIASPVPKMNASIDSPNKIEIHITTPRIQAVNSSDKAKQSVINPNNNAKSPAVIPVAPIHVRTRDIKNIPPAIAVIHKISNKIPVVKNGIAVHIVHRHAVDANPAMQRHNDAAAKHAVSNASVNADKARQIIPNPKIIQINPKHGMLHPIKVIISPRTQARHDAANMVKEIHNMQSMTMMPKDIAAKHVINPHIATDDTKMIDNSRTAAMRPINTIQPVTVANDSVIGIIIAQIIPNIRPRHITARARTNPIVPAKTRARNNAGLQTQRDNIDAMQQAIMAIPARQATPIQTAPMLVQIKHKPIVAAIKQNIKLQQINSGTRMHPAKDKIPARQAQINPEIIGMKQKHCATNKIM